MCVIVTIAVKFTSDSDVLGLSLSVLLHQHRERLFRLRRSWTNQFISSDTFDMYTNNAARLSQPFLRALPRLSPALDVPTPELLETNEDGDISEDNDVCLNLPSRKLV